MSLEIAIIDLTTQTTGLLDTCTALRDSTSRLIADAVIVSQNAALIPLVSVTTNLIDMQTLLVTYIVGGNK